MLMDSILVYTGILVTSSGGVMSIVLGLVRR